MLLTLFDCFKKITEVYWFFIEITNIWNQKNFSNWDAEFIKYTEVMFSGNNFYQQ